MQRSNSTSAPSPVLRSRYDGLTILLHWLTALAALFHHYVLRDGILRRMLPGSAGRP
jgi:cytochrome b561